MSPADWVLVVMLVANFGGLSLLIWCDPGGVRRHTEEES